LPGHLYPDALQAAAAVRGMASKVAVLAVALYTRGARRRLERAARASASYLVASLAGRAVVRYPDDEGMTRVAARGPKLLRRADHASGGVARLATAAAQRHSLRLSFHEALARWRRAAAENGDAPALPPIATPRRLPAAALAAAETR